MSQDSTIRVKVLGIFVGTAVGWDCMDDLAYCFYGYESNNSVFPSCDCLELDYDQGTWSATDDAGNVLNKGSIFDLSAL